MGKKTVWFNKSGLDKLPNDKLTGDSIPSEKKERRYNHQLLPSRPSYNT
jgi:hypothetical protein